MRDLIKMQYRNDGTRSLFESTMLPELILALEDWRKSSVNSVLIGGAGLSYYVKPRMTQDLDFLFLSENDIPEQVSGFKRIRSHGFQHNKTHVQIEALTPEFLKISNVLVQEVFNTALESDGVKIASPSGIVVLKLGRLSMQDKADIVALIKTGKVDLSSFTLSTDKLKKYSELVKIAKNDTHPN